MFWLVTFFSESEIHKCVSLFMSNYLFVNFLKMFSYKSVSLYPTTHVQTICLQPPTSPDLTGRCGLLPWETTRTTPGFWTWCAGFCRTSLKYWSYWLTTRSPTSHRNTSEQHSTTIITQVPRVVKAGHIGKLLFMFAFMRYQWKIKAKADPVSSDTIDIWGPIDKLHRPILSDVFTALIPSYHSVTKSQTPPSPQISHFEILSPKTFSLYRVFSTVLNSNIVGKNVTKRSH